LVIGAWDLVIHSNKPLTPALSPAYQGEGVARAAIYKPLRRMRR
jgi:hypothetical protein